MIIVKNQLNKKEEQFFRIFLAELTDFYSDFYITKDRIRLDIKENVDLFLKEAKKGNKLLYGEKEGIAGIVGYADNFPRKYLKILAKDENGADKLVRRAIEIVDCDLWAKIKKKNPLIKILYNNGFIHKGNRGKELLMYYEKYKNK